MKRSIYGIFALALITAGVTSCNKEEAQEPLEPGTAEVSGKLTANLDETDFQMQAVPEGTGVTFIINGEDLERDPQVGYNYEDAIVKATVDADGNYTASLPAVQKSIEVQVVFDDFDYEATILTTNDEGFQEAVVERRTFSHDPETVDIVDGKVLVKDYTYDQEGADFVFSAMIRGVVEAQFVDNVGEPVGGLAVVNGGTGYTNPNEVDVDVTGGAGTGMTVDYFTDGAGVVTNVFINTAGEGYKIGDVLTIDDGGEDATFEITNVNPVMETVPADVLLTFTVNGDPYKVVTDASGEYMVKLPANVGGATIKGVDFETASVFEDPDNAGEYITGNKIYEYNGPGFQNLDEGDIIELDLTYARK